MPMYFHCHRILDVCNIWIRLDLTKWTQLNKESRRVTKIMPHYVYEIPMPLEQAWHTSLEYWQKAYNCEIKETRDTANGGRFLLIQKKFDMSFGFKIDLQFDPVQDATRVTIKSGARASQLSQFGRFIRDWCRTLGIPDQGVLGKSIGQSFIVPCVCCGLILILIIWAVFFAKK